MPTHTRLGRAVVLRLDAGRPLTLLSPTSAALCGLLASGGIRLDQHTVVLSLLLFLLVGPLMGGLWEVVAKAGDAAPETAQGDLPSLAPAPWQKAGELPSPQSSSHREAGGGPAILPYARPGSAGYRLLSVLTGSAQGWQEHGWPVFSSVAILAFALAVASILGAVIVALAVALVVLVVRLRLRTGTPAIFLQAIYDFSLPWLMGMVVLGQVAENGWASYWPGLALAVAYTVVCVGCLAMACGVHVPALLMLDLAQAAVLWLLVTRHETLAVWLFGLCLIGQLAAHPTLLAGGEGQGYLRRVSLYIVTGMIAGVAALAPALAGL